MQPKQLSMFGASGNKERVFHVFHDESGAFVPATPGRQRSPDSRWLLHGVLFVPASRQTQAVQLLAEARQKTGYFSELHFVGLRRSIAGAKGRCAQAWLELYLDRLADFCYFHALAVDSFSDGFRHERFQQAHIAYNFFAKMALVGGIVWSLASFSDIALKIYSDEKYRGENDNFAHYLPRETARTIAKKRTKAPHRYPRLRFVEDRVLPANSDPAKAAASELESVELIQLVDLITSGIRQAITARSKQNAKIQVAELLANWVEDSRRPPWLQRADFHRRFSLSSFPNASGAFYRSPLAVQLRNQLKLL